MIAYAFLQHRRLVEASGEKKNQRTAPADASRRPARDRRPAGSRAASSMPALQKTNPQITRINLPK